MPLSSRLVLILLLLVPGIGRAGDRADFSGLWTMDPARSESAHQAAPIGTITLLIDQTPTELTIETKRESSQSAIATETLTYKLDGSEITIERIADQPIKTRGYWDGRKLVTETARVVSGSSITQKHVLSLDRTGRELKIEKTLTVQHGYQAQQGNNRGTGIDWFVKTRSPAKRERQQRP